MKIHYGQVQVVYGHRSTLHCCVTQTHQVWLTSVCHHISYHSIFVFCFKVLLLFGWNVMLHTNIMVLILINIPKKRKKEKLKYNLPDVNFIYYKNWKTKIIQILFTYFCFLSYFVVVIVISWIKHFKYFIKIVYFFSLLYVLESWKEETWQIHWVE